MSAATIMDPSSERDLTGRARAGDQSALNALFDAQRASLERMVALRLDPRLARRMEPVDVVQEAWIEAVKRFEGWRARTELPARVWLRLVVGQALTDAERRHFGAQMRDPGQEKFEASRSRINAVRLAEVLVTSATTPTQAVQRDELRTRVLGAIEGLDEIDREIVTMRYLEGLSNEDAALELGIEAAAASKRLMRALMRLRPMLEALSPEPNGGGRPT